MTDGITLTGFLDDEVIAEDAGTRARFRVCVSPSADRVDELALPCSVADPEVAHTVLSGLQPGDRIRVTGYLGLPHVAGHPLWLHVTALELLATAVSQPSEDAGAAPASAHQDATTQPATAALSDRGLLERYGPYVVWTDPDLCADSIWTETGEWVGTAAYPTTAADLINAHQRRTDDDA